jgi:signal transduction histidine kinase
VNLDRNVNEIYADKDRIFEVLSNVIDNALKFTKKGKIKIESHVMIQDHQEGDNNDDHNNNNNKIEIKVSDTGAGIPEDILPHLFGKFVAKNVIGKESRQGSGLGLFISKAIVKAHNGEITAHNNESGTGATVSIVLPTRGTNINSDSDGNCNC